MIANRRRWLRAEDEYIKAHYAEMPGAELAEELNRLFGGGRTRSGVTARAHHLGLEAKRERGYVRTGWEAVEEHLERITK